MISNKEILQKQNKIQQQQSKQNNKNPATYPCPLEAAVFAASLTIAKGPKRRQLESLACSLVPAATFQFLLL